MKEVTLPWKLGPMGCVEGEQGSGGPVTVQERNEEVGG